MSTPKAGRLVRVGLYDLTPGYLGKGNFAIVRLGIHRLTKTSVAVKIVEKSDLDEENLQKISREIEIMRHLNHPSIIRLFQVRPSFVFLHFLVFVHQRYFSCLNRDFFKAYDRSVSVFMTR